MFRDTLGLQHRARCTRAHAHTQPAFSCSPPFQPDWRNSRRANRAGGGGVEDAFLTVTRPRAASWLRWLRTCMRACTLSTANAKHWRGGNEGLCDACVWQDVMINTLLLSSGVYWAQRPLSSGNVNPVRGPQACAQGFSWVCSIFFF